jgi:GMP synthase (glutamine-hydrolysing)
LAEARTTSSNGSAPRVLIILHQEHSNPGRVGRLLKTHGAELDIRRPSLGDPLPKTLEDHAGAIIFGGPMSANDEHDWLKAEIDWIGVPLREKKPFIGLCLGAQMLARHMGERVYKHPDGKVEIGYHPILPTEAGHRLCGCSFPARVYQWHREGFDLPRGASLLAEGDVFEVQAIAVGEQAFGFQFHPEVTYAMMCRWTVRGHDRMTLPGAFPRHQHLRDWFSYDPAVARWLDCFLTDWLAGKASAGQSCALAGAFQPREAVAGEVAASPAA